MPWLTWRMNKNKHCVKNMNLTLNSLRITTMTKPKFQEDDIVIHVIVIISIFIQIILEALQCLTSQNSRGSTPEPTKPVTQSTPTTRTSTSNTKTQRSSPSTKRRSTTAVQRKVDGGTKQDTQSEATASSPRSRRSKPTSSTSKSTRSKASPLLEIQRLAPTPS